MNPRHRVAVTAALAVAALVASLFPPWAAVDEGGGFFDLIGRSSAVTSFLGVGYLLFTLVAVGLAGAAGFVPPGFRWYVAGAGLAALLDAAAVAGVGYRVWHADLPLGAGWYVAVVAVLATCLTAAGCAIGHPARHEDG